MTAPAPAADGGTGGLATLAPEADFDDVLLEALLAYDLDAPALGGGGLELAAWAGGVAGRASAATPLRCLDSKHDAARCTECVAAVRALTRSGAA